jgi:RNA polymerase primary sigma factor
MGLPFDDLVQEGALGLLDAIERFEPCHGVGFEAYAHFRVRRAIRNALTDQARLVRLPKLVVERRRMLARTEASLTAAANGRVPTPAELAAATGLSFAAVVEARTAAITPVSLDDPILADGPTLESLVADRYAHDPELETLEWEEARLLEAAVERLPTRQGQVVRRHFGLDRAAEPIGHIATGLHLSPQRTRAIERDALSELRAKLEIAEVAP